MEKVKYKVSRTSGAGLYNDESPCGDSVKREAYGFFSIEFSSQLELLNFINFYKIVVIRPLDEYNKYFGCNFEIEIYDDYRE